MSLVTHSPTCRVNHHLQTIIPRIRNLLDLDAYENPINAGRSGPSAYLNIQNVPVDVRKQANRGRIWNGTQKGFLEGRKRLN